MQTHKIVLHQPSVFLLMSLCNTFLLGCSKSSGFLLINRYNKNDEITFVMLYLTWYCGFWLIFLSSTLSHLNEASCQVFNIRREKSTWKAWMPSVTQLLRGRTLLSMNDLRHIFFYMIYTSASTLIIKYHGPAKQSLDSNHQDTIIINSDWNSGAFLCRDG